MKRLLAVGSGLVLFGSAAFAEGTGLTVPQINTADFGAVGTAVLAALAVLWAVRRAIHLLGR